MSGPAGIGTPARAAGAAVLGGGERGLHRCGGCHARAGCRLLDQPHDRPGPVGLRRMMQNFFAYEKFDIDTRISDEGREDRVPGGRLVLARLLRVAEERAASSLAGITPSFGNEYASLAADQQEGGRGGAAKETRYRDFQYASSEMSTSSSMLGFTARE